jgi:hypothetical protein
MYCTSRPEYPRTPANNIWLWIMSLKRFKHSHLTQDLPCYHTTHLLLPLQLPHLLHFSSMYSIFNQNHSILQSHIVVTMRTGCLKQVTKGISRVFHERTPSNLACNSCQSLGSVLIDDTISLNFTVNGMNLPSMRLPRWPIDQYTICCAFFVAEHAGCYLLWCKDIPHTLVIDQRILEDGSVVTAEVTGVADRAKKGPASKFNTVFFNNPPFVVFVIHADVGAGTLIKCENVL